MMIVIYQMGLGFNFKVHVDSDIAYDAPIFQVEIKNIAWFQNLKLSIRVSGLRKCGFRCSYMHYLYNI